MQDYTKSELYLEPQTTILSETDAAKALFIAFKNVWGAPPKRESLAILFAQTALETGRFKLMRNFNWGNIKKRLPSSDKYKFTMFRCGEIINGKQHFFDPPHPETAFRAYESAEGGAEDYISLLLNKSTFKPAWEQLIAGNPEQYSLELYKGKYYTANPTIYTSVLKKIYSQFLKNWDENKDLIIPVDQEILSKEEVDFVNNTMSIRQISNDKNVDYLRAEVPVKKTSWFKKLFS